MSSLSIATSSSGGGVPLIEMTEKEVSHRNHSLDAIATLISALTEYFQALTGFCGAGVKLARNFIGTSAIASIIPPQDKDEIQKIFSVWEEIDKVTQQAAATIRTQTMQALQNWLARHRSQTSENVANEGGTNKQPDLSKLLSSCLVLIMQLQYQFCLMHSQSFAKDREQQAASSGGGSGLMVFQGSASSPKDGFIDNAARASQCKGTEAALQAQCQRPEVSPPPLNCPCPPLPLDLLSVPTPQDSSSDRNSSCDGGDSNYLDDDEGSWPEEPMLARLLQERRSSYGGSLHTASPPPPDSALGRRWSVPGGGGDAALEEGWTREVQKRSGNKLPHYVAGIGRAIRGTGSTLTRGSLASKEMLDSVIDLLSCRQDGRSTKSPITPSSSQTQLQLSNAMMPLCTSSADCWPPTMNQSTQLPLVDRQGKNGGYWGWSTAVQNRNCCTDRDGLLAVASANFKNRDLKGDGWSNNSARQLLPHLDGCKSSKQRGLSPPSAGSKREEQHEMEGAFSIGLNLSGSNLVSSVQQWKRENEKTAIPVVLTPPMEDKLDSSAILINEKAVGSKETVWPLNGKSTGQTAGVFLPLAVEGPPGPTIWTPSPSDYAAPRGSQPFHLRTLNSSLTH